LAGDLVVCFLFVKLCCALQVAREIQWCMLRGRVLFIKLLLCMSNLRNAFSHSSTHTLSHYSLTHSLTHSLSHFLSLTLSLSLSLSLSLTLTHSLSSVSNATQLPIALSTTIATTRLVSHPISGISLSKKKSNDVRPYLHQDYFSVSVSLPCDFFFPHFVDVELTANLMQCFSKKLFLQERWIQG
jgi:hypothetical protein